MAELKTEGYSIKELREAVRLFYRLEIEGDSLPIYLDIRDAVQHLDTRDKKVFDLFARGFIYKEIGRFLEQFLGLERKDDKETGRTAVNRLLRNLSKAIEMVGKGVV